jgi:hypothetical protein
LPAADKRCLFLSTTLLFAFHSALNVIVVVFKKDFVIVPFLCMPRLGVFEALMYLPTAFLSDLGIVAVVLYSITRTAQRTLTTMSAAGSLDVPGHDCVPAIERRYRPPVSSDFVPVAPAHQTASGRGFQLRCHLVWRRPAARQTGFRTVATSQIRLEFRRSRPGRKDRRPDRLLSEARVLAGPGPLDDIPDDL